MRRVSAKWGVVKNHRFSTGARLLAVLSATIPPTQLFAQTCAAIRPTWDASLGPVTAWGEAAYIFQSPFGIATLGMLALAILTFKTTWIAASFASAAGLGALLYFGDAFEDQTGLGQATLAEGCTGPTSNAVAICAAICLICAGIFALKRRLKGE